MSTTQVEETRIRKRNDRGPKRSGDYVFYWMQQSQRAEHSPALEFAVQRANELGLRLLVGFGLMDDYPDANLRHYAFMLEGLRETQEALKRRNIKMVVQCGHPAKIARTLGRSAAVVVCDRGYLRHQRHWRDEVAKEAACEVVEVEGDVVVPVEAVSDKLEYAARTIRPKIERQRDDYLVELKTTPLEKHSLNLSVEGVDLSDLDVYLETLKVDRSVKPVRNLFPGGTNAAKRRLKDFLTNDFDGYDGLRNQPQTDAVSHMSKYLHFGQISPVAVALAAQDAKAPSDDKKSFLEELVVRRELGCNYCYYCRDYDRFKSLPEWAIETLEEHADDARPHVYTMKELERSETHDPYWNAAMKEMRVTGYMHNYMRMYWGKKILEWTNTPRYAFRVALELNNRYFLDGRDCASFANVAWLFGRHDRGWPERPVYGKVRSMTAKGLERKCDIAGYVAKVEALAAGA